MPRIEIHSEYSALLNNSESEVASYVSEKYQHVQWIMRSLKQKTNPSASDDHYYGKTT